MSVDVSHMELANTVDEVHRRVVARYAEHDRHLMATGGTMTGADERQFVNNLVMQELTAVRNLQVRQGYTQASADDDNTVITMVMSRVFGHGEMDALLGDVSISDINMTGCDGVFVRRTGSGTESAPAVFSRDDELISWVRQRAQEQGTVWDDAHPLVEFELSGGHRLSGVLPPVAQRPSVAIRLLRCPDWTLADLVAHKTISEALAEFLNAAVKARCNILISGETGAGKTQLLRGLTSAIPAAERLVTVEHFYELGLHRIGRHHNVTALKTRAPNAEGAGEVPIAELVRKTKRLDPDRVIVGECVGPEIVELLNALGQGNDGGMTTMHSRSGRGVVSQVKAYAQQAGLDPMMGVSLLANGIDFVVHVAKVREADRIIRRVVMHVEEVTGFDGTHMMMSRVWEKTPFDDLARQQAALTQERADMLAAHGWEPDESAVPEVHDW